MPKLDRPIFVIGVGRCGSTVFHEVFAHHPGLSWMSPLLDQYPDEPERNARMIDWAGAPGAGPLLRRKYRPDETYKFWDHYYHGFSEPCRDLVAGDVTLRVEKKLPAALAQAVSRRRPRLLVKLTGWPRLGFLQKIFPDAYFIHVLRDWRGTVNSILNVHFWRGWRGPNNWRWGPLSAEHEELWRRHDRSFVALASIQMLIYAEAMQQSLGRIDRSRFHEIRYEDLCAHPEEKLADAARFCELDGGAEVFAPALEKSPMRDSNFKWRSDLSSEQQALLTDILAPVLERYGYRLEPAAVAGVASPGDAT